MMFFVRYVCNCKPKQEIDSAEKSAKVFLLNALHFAQRGLGFPVFYSYLLSMLIDVRRNQSRKYDTI
jgi:hypothetical protein